ncbi:MAG: hypothetical protein K2Y51_14580 [Gammaproteobacteria bacterium]|nr:hypothetical protein [Gammaproteobacteria bacterium]
MRRALACLLSLLLTLAVPRVPRAETALEQRFDCEQAFDLIATLVIARCAAWQAPPGAADKLAATRARLLTSGQASGAELEAPRIAFCPLAAGTGMVPAPRTLYLDDGLVELSVDGLAEILAHELEHVAQFERLGSRNFKCDYVRAMVACGGCQDRRNALEAEAYARQDAVREALAREVTPAP